MPGLFTVGFWGNNIGCQVRGLLRVLSGCLWGDDGVMTNIRGPARAASDWVSCSPSGGNW